MANLKSTTITGNTGGVGLSVEPAAGRLWYTGVDGGGNYIEQAGTQNSERIFRIQSSDGSSAYVQFFIDGGAQTIRLCTNTIERLRITSQGYITTPYQPSFSAYLSGSWTHPSGVQLVEGDWATQHNIGSHYSTTTRRFTVPIAGVYKFDCIIATLGGAGSFAYLSAELWKNGSRARIGGWGCGGAGGSYGETASSYVIQLDANDYVQLGCESNKSFTLQNGAGGHTLFSGYLIG